ncbi:MAG: hypothetical protein M1825_002214 [Sarcosagium campestre]|nr:MAG: hypothetical protein M1825_002214 [Sarcosagium campestre]
MHLTLFKAALKAKNLRLVREFELLRESTKDISWCAAAWWRDGEEQLTIRDWLLVDAWYRSRALSFAAAGDAMVPCIDMANHAQGEGSSAFFDRDAEGNAVLCLPNDKKYACGDEITISYGDNKSASENLFSYGFIDRDTRFTTGLTLDLAVPEDDPLKDPKESVSTTAPAVRITSKDDSVKWESDFLWLACVNEEDGLRFEVFNTTDGSRELHVFWDDRDITDNTGNLTKLIEDNPIWEVFQLRAVVSLQDRVSSQIVRLTNSTAWSQTSQGSDVNPDIRSVAQRLREFEFEFLERTLESLEKEKVNLLESEVVRSFLGGAILSEQ